MTIKVKSSACFFSKPGVFSWKPYKIPYFPDLFMGKASKYAIFKAFIGHDCWYLVGTNMPVWFFSSYRVCGVRQGGKLVKN